MKIRTVNRKREGKMIWRKTISIVLVVAFTLMFVPVSEAKWHDQSSQLPGMDGGDNTLLIVSGVLAAVAAVVLIASHGKNRKKKEDKIESEIDWQINKVANNGCEPESGNILDISNVNCK